MTALNDFNERMYELQNTPIQDAQLRRLAIAVEVLGMAVQELDRRIASLTRISAMDENIALGDRAAADESFGTLEQRLTLLERRIAFQAAEWELDEYLATHDVFALHADERLDAKALAKTMQGLRDTPPRDVVRILAKRGWEWNFIARSMRTTPDAPYIWTQVTEDDVAAIFGGADYPTSI